jgi:hypothetical protein
MQTQGFTNVLWVSEVKEQPREHNKRKRMSNSFASKSFEKIVKNPSLVPALYRPSFLVHFERLKV